MNPIDQLTERIIKCAIEVHRQLGPGLLEGAYCIELEEEGLRYQRQLIIPVTYKGRTIGEYRLDLVIGRPCHRGNQECGAIRSGLRSSNPDLSEDHGKKGWATNQLQLTTLKGRNPKIRSVASLCLCDSVAVLLTPL